MAANVPAPLKPIDIECVIYADTSKPDGTPRKLLDASKLSALLASAHHPRGEYTADLRVVPNLQEALTATARGREPVRFRNRATKDASLPLSSTSPAVE